MTMSRPSLARINGALLLLMAFAAGFAELGARAKLIIPGDPERTAATAHGALFQAGFAGYLTAFLLDVPVALLFYALLRPTAKTLAAISASLRLVYAVLAIGNLHLYLSGRLEAYEHGFKLALALFGVHLLVLGVLLFESRLVPRALGLLVVVAGCAYVVDTLTVVVWRDAHALIAPYLVLPESFEIVLALWLLVLATARDGGEPQTTKGATLTNHGLAAFDDTRA
jgi:hypothetical protein